MSAKNNGIRIDFLGIIDPEVDPGVPGGRELVALAHTAATAEPDPSSVNVLVDAVGPGPAVTAIEIAGAFTIINRIMHATGCPIPVRRLTAARPLLELLGAMDFPNADLVSAHKKKPQDQLRRIVRRLRR